MLKRIITGIILGCVLLAPCQTDRQNTASAETMGDYSLIPPFVTAGVPPLVMLVLGKDHKLYYEAYNDASDINGDGTLDVSFNPSIEYYGYFDPYKCYTYQSSRFEPTGDVTNATTRTCSGNWSGNYMNYLTMSRMDCLRKVLYGGYRSTDTATETVLQRAYIPQDAHTWGKEYDPLIHTHFNISDYTPLSTPVTGKRHLFASTTLSDNGTPILRVLPDNPARIWEWVSKERPVADDSLEITGGNYTSAITSHAQFNTVFSTYAVPEHQIGSETAITTINQNQNDDYRITKITGTLSIPVDGSYQFSANINNTAELIIDGTTVRGWYTNPPPAYCDQVSCIGSTTPPRQTWAINLSAGQHTIEFRHHELTDNGYFTLWWRKSNAPSAFTYEIVPPLTAGRGLSNLKRTYYNTTTTPSQITDYNVRVLVGTPSSQTSGNHKQYITAGAYKPIGLLQKHGESNRMYFGLTTGSYAKNTSGGVVRKNVGPIIANPSTPTSTSNEINPTDGTFITGANGIIQTLNRLRIYGFNYSDYSHNLNCGWIATRPINEGECRCWGNPIAEMMYETLRYFAGAARTTAFDYSSGDDVTLSLPKPTWINPYNPSAGGYSHCAKPFMLVISDIYPSFDTDQLPGTPFPLLNSTSYFTGTFTTPDNSLNVQTLANTISSSESIAGERFIGQSGTGTGSYDNACTEKTVTGFGNIRGLCPEEPTKQGGYFSPAVSYYGLSEDLNSAQGDQKVVTYAVALASPKPEILIPVGGKQVSLVPFAKSVAGYAINASSSAFQPTNTLVDFYVDTITPTAGRFRINWEDVEQGADHDMDAIVIYEYSVNTATNQVTVTLTSEYSAGSITQHMGFIISGTSEDGTYLGVRDSDTAAGSDVNYFLDTPQHPGGDLPLTWTKTFSVGTASAATLIKNPLWYAAKWGGFEDSNANGIPDVQSEWDKDVDGVPDNYFYVANPLKLEEQLNKSFADILRRSASGTAASVISSSRSGEGAIYQAVFYPEYKDSLGNTVNWVGELHAFLVDSYGMMREDTNGNGKLDFKCPTSNPTCNDLDFFVEFSATSQGTIYKYKDVNLNGQLEASEMLTPVVANSMRACRPEEIAATSTGSARTDCVAYLWASGNVLNEISAANVTAQRNYTDDFNLRYVFTFLDGTSTGLLNGIPEITNEIVPFTAANEAYISPFLHVYPPFESAPAAVTTLMTSNPSAFNTLVHAQSARLINYIRGQDQAADSTTVPSYTLPAMRSRQCDYDEDSTAETWRMADIVYSTPTIVATPSEDFDLLYRDGTYTQFYQKYKRRRTVVYTGANDGMLHAFNGGFYSSADKKFYKGPFSTTTGTWSDTGKPLGAELWAYVPYNLLPHLYWLSDENYDSNYHVAYVDLKPRIFDAKIFNADAVHPQGWGTVLVCGMRFGGGKIRADLDKNNVFDATDRRMTSAYIIMDVTDPEAPPQLLAEVTSEDLGYTTNYPTVITLKDKTALSDPTKNKWYLVLGSGPHGTGEAGTSGQRNALLDATSDQPGKLVLVDLNALVAGATTSAALKTINGTTNLLQDGVHVYASLDTNTFISDPISVDYDLDYKADAVYFGTVSGNFTLGWGGKMRRIVVDDRDDFTLWDKDSVMIDLTNIAALGYGQPIVAAPTVAKDKSGVPWIFFGTGRFFNRQDAPPNPLATRMQSYYGIKEALNTSTSPATILYSEPAATRDTTSLLDVTNAVVYEGGQTVQGVPGASDFAGVKLLVSGKNGWFLNLTDPIGGERNLGQATLLGDILTFTTYMPSADACEFEGVSNLYALYYTTGTAYTSSVIGLGSSTIVEGSGPTAQTKHNVLKMVSLGKGLTITPNIHTGRQEGSSIFVQTSTGTILKLQEANPGMVKSGRTAWQEW